MNNKMETRRMLIEEFCHHISVVGTLKAGQGEVTSRTVSPFRKKKIFYHFQTYSSYIKKEGKMKELREKSVIFLF